MFSTFDLFRKSPRKISLANFFQVGKFSGEFFLEAFFPDNQWRMVQMQMKYDCTKKKYVKIYPGQIYLVKVNNGNTRVMCEICS